jgi:hypothetical protein
MQVDPLAVKYAPCSPYTYAQNNPIYFNDPLGAEPDPYLQQLIEQLLSDPNFIGGTITRDQDGNWVSSVYGNLDAGFFAGAQYAAYYNMWGMFPGMASSFDAALERYNGGFITATMAAAFYTATWGGQAINVSAGYLMDGFGINFTATSTGNSYTNMFVSVLSIKGYFEQIKGLYGNSSGEGGMNGLDKAQKVTDVALLSSDLTINGLIGAQKLANAAANTSHGIINLSERILVKGVTVDLAGRALGYASAGYTLYKFAEKPSVGRGLELAISAVSFVPGWGWAVGAAYFFADVIVVGITDRSIAEHIDGE